ncbi:MAG: glycosyltransferase N-terminal domain-containing protein, partial [Bacteroidota bacterium]
AKNLLALIEPKMLILIKYEFWFNLLNACHQSKIPTFLVSGIFRKDQIFFKSYGRSFLKVLSNMEHLFVQRDYDKELLSGKNFSNVTVLGDSRIDRVIEISKSEFEDEHLNSFTSNANLVLIAGSSWPSEEKMLSEIREELHKEQIKLIIVPHEVDESHIESIQQYFPNSIMFSKSDKNLASKDILIIDKIGLLSKIYRYGQIAIIGGGFGKGIHNILEPAAYGLPILIGPNWKKFEEAHQLINLNTAFEFTDSAKLLKIIRQLCDDPTLRNQIKEKLNKYINTNQGVSNKFLSYLEANHYLD